MNIGKVIKQRRKQLDLTQVTLANRIGISQTYLSQIENDDRNMTIKTLSNIATNLNISFAYLIFESININAELTYNEKMDILKNLFSSLIPK